MLGTHARRGQTWWEIGLIDDGPRWLLRRARARAGARRRRRAGQSWERWGGDCGEAWVSGGDDLGGKQEEVDGINNQGQRERCNAGTAVEYSETSDAREIALILFLFLIEFDGCLRRGVEIQDTWSHNLHCQIWELLAARRVTLLEDGVLHPPAMLRT